MRAHRTLLFRLSVLGAFMLLVLALGLVLLMRRGVRDVTTEFHDRNATLFRTTVEHMGERMRSEIEDVPYDLFGDDREALRNHLAERAAVTESHAIATTRAFTEYYGRHLDDEIDRSVVWIAGGLVGLVFLLLIVHGIALYGLVVRPIRRLDKATRSIAEGDLTAHVPGDRRDEIGGLARSFNTMVERLRESRDEITEWNRTLGQRVEEAGERLVQAEKMASLGRMAGGVAHEFNNMLGGILGIAEEAERDESLDEVRESLRVIARTAARANLVTGNLLRFARPGPSRPPEPVDVGSLLADAVALVEAEAEKRDIEVAVEVAPSLGLVARPEEIHQVLLNLLMNAVQAMPDGGRLAVDARAEGDTTVLRVEDSGAGIPPDSLEHVFEPFFTSRPDGEPPGTGLGLAVAYGIVAGHGGTIDIDSEPDVGTTVTVRLPTGGHEHG